MIRYAVVAVDGNGEVVVVSAHRSRWMAELRAEAAMKAVQKHTLSWMQGLIAVYVEDAGPRALGEMLRANLPHMSE